MQQEWYDCYVHAAAAVVVVRVDTSYQSCIFIIIDSGLHQKLGASRTRVEIEERHFPKSMYGLCAMHNDDPGQSWFEGSHEAAAVAAAFHAWTAVMAVGDDAITLKGCRSNLFPSHCNQGCCCSSHRSKGHSINGKGPYLYSNQEWQINWYTCTILEKKNVPFYKTSLLLYFD
jgi:hypothetical protein